MKLTLPDMSIRESPTAEDIAAAVTYRPRPYGWKLSLDAGSEILSASIEDGEVCLAVDDEVDVLGIMVPRKTRVLDPIDEALLESLLASYSAGDGRWRKLCRWSTPEDDKQETKLHWVSALLINLWILVVIFACIPDQSLPKFIPVHLRGQDIWLALFPATVAGGITWAIAYYLNEKLHLLMQMASWAKGRAVILQSEILTEQHLDSYNRGEGSATPTRSTVVTLYSARVAYEYSLGFKRYFSTRIGLADDVSDSDESAARAIVARYPVGTEVPIFYDPRHPSRSALERGIPKAGHFGLLVGIGVVMLLLTLAIIVGFIMPAL